MIIKASEYYPGLLASFEKVKAPAGNPGGRDKKVKYLDCVCAFDIETTTMEERDINFMYIWQFQIDLNLTVMGRTWDEFRTFMNKLKKELDRRKAWLVIYVHNLSYEFQYIQNIFEFTSKEVFATDARKVLKCTAMNCFEFRCSYFLTNMSLSSFLRKFKVEHQKLELDYDKIRFPWSFMTSEEYAYCANDVIGLVEAIRAQMKRDGDTLYTIPLTATGYPRRDMKRAMKKYPHNKLWAMQPDLPVYELLRAAFRGGNTHANRYYAGKILKNVVSWDRSSSYPDVLCNCMFPMGSWRSEPASASALKDLIDSGDRAVIFSCTLRDVELRNPIWPVPYLSVDKCSNLYGYEKDNGRILRAEFLQTVLTDVDFRILLSEYKFEISVDEMYSSPYDWLPPAMIYTIASYYQKKTSLKGIEGEEAEGEEAEGEYMRSKEAINGLYGLMAMDPIREEVVFEDGEWKVNGNSIEEKEKKLKKNAITSSLCYAWGVWCTSWARLRLEEGICIATPEYFVYCDTDSVKYIDMGQSWEMYNAQRIHDSTQTHTYASDPKGRKHYMGVYEEDGRYQRFITLGAKRYAYEDEDGKLHITISGVNKKAGAAELQSLENFHEGFRFFHPGKTESIYVDKKTTERITINGHELELTSFIIIRPTTYYLGLTEDYRNLLQMINY